jgi:hypothetical protein
MKAITLRTSIVGVGSSLAEYGAGGGRSLSGAPGDRGEPDEGRDDELGQLNDPDEPDDRDELDEREEPDELGGRPDE